MFTKLAGVMLTGVALSGIALAQNNTPSLKILLPEHTRLLQGQLVDIVIEVRNAAAITGLKVMAGSVDLTSKFSAPVTADLDCDASSDLVVRADLQSFEAAGSVKLIVTANAGSTALSDERDVLVRPFALGPGQRKNVILFIGDAMGTAYRDSARLVSRAIIDSNGRNSFRDGFFDDLLEMDKMPVSGMSMTYGTDSIVPDSANTGTAWSTGNKSFLNAVNVFEDGDDCKWRFTNAVNAANLSLITDNPRVETLWEYLKRRYGYRTGIVTTADVTDATPAVQGSHTANRGTRSVITEHYLENPMLGGRPAFDVIMGGGRDHFTAQGRTDRRDMIAAFQAQGFRLVQSATELRAVRFGQPTLGLFKGNATPRPSKSGVAASDSNMDVAYDKLGFTRPASEPRPNFGTYTDQPMLELMTEKAIEVLSSTFSGTPFVLMVEAASIDKQSHPNHAAGVIWDAIEMDRSVGVARKWAAARNPKDTLIVVTADHDQSIQVIGVSNIPDAEYFNDTQKSELTLNTTRGEQKITVYNDSYTNTRAGLPFINSSGGAAQNSGPAGAPGNFASRSVATNPASGTYSTYFGSTGYYLDRSGYPSNAAPQGQTLRRLAVGFRTGDHTGSSVPVTAEGPGALLFTGYMDQTDIFFKMAASLSSDTSALDAALTQLTGSAYPSSIGK